MDILGFLFGQTAEWHDLAIIGLLIILEGVLSIDNALVLGLLAKRLPKNQQGKALTYGLVGAFVFRLIAIATAAYLLKWRFVKLLGGGYLVYVAAKHFLEREHPDDEHRLTTNPAGEPTLVQADTGAPLNDAQSAEELDERSPLPVNHESPRMARRLAKFWPTVMVIELTDIAFAIDSILAAIALVGSPPAGHDKDLVHPKLWVVITGGMLGVILMRFAAVMFIKLLEKFPRFETSAYLLVLVIGGKLVADWGFNSEAHPHRIDFHDLGSWPFWAFWIAMLACFAIGFIPKRHKHANSPDHAASR